MYRLEVLEEIAADLITCRLWKEDSDGREMNRSVKDEGKNEREEKKEKKE